MYLLDWIYNGEYCLGKERKISIVSDDMITDFFGNKNINPIITELFIRGSKLNISLFCCYTRTAKLAFAIRKDFRLNSRQFLL